MKNLLETWETLHKSLMPSFEVIADNGFVFNLLM